MTIKHTNAVMTFKWLYLEGEQGQPLMRCCCLHNQWTQKGSSAWKPQRIVLCVFCCQCVCKNGVVCVWGGDYSHQSLFVNMWDHMFVCAWAWVYTKGNCPRRRMQSSPLLAHINNPQMLWQSHTHRPVAARRGTSEQGLQTSAAQQPRFFSLWLSLLFESI